MSHQFCRQLKMMETHREKFWLLTSLITLIMYYILGDESLFLVYHPLDLGL